MERRCPTTNCGVLNGHRGKGCPSTIFVRVSLGGLGILGGVNLTATDLRRQGSRYAASPESRVFQVTRRSGASRNMCVKMVSSHIRGTIRIMATLTKEIIEA